MINYVLAGLKRDLDHKFHEECKALDFDKYNHQDIKRRLNYQMVNFIQDLVNKDKAPSEFFWFGVCYVRSSIEDYLDNYERHRMIADEQ